MNDEVNDEKTNPEVILLRGYSVGAHGFEPRIPPTKGRSALNQLSLLVFRF